MKLTTALGLILLAVAAVLHFTDGDKPLPPPDAPEPSAEMQTLVAPVKAFHGKAGVGVVADFYRRGAGVLAKDANVKTTGQFRSVHGKAQAYFAGQVNVPGLSAAIDGVLMQSLGKDDGPINRQRVVDTMNAIAWALGG